MNSAIESDCQGLAIVHAGHPVRLKWHRLRRCAGDPPFGATVLQHGLRIGASMELDLRVRQDGGFVVFHDATLQGQTDGVGAVADCTAEQLRALRLRSGPNGGTAPLMLSEDLAPMLRTASPQALLQFDMKDDLATISEPGVEHLARWFAQTTAPVIVSGKCPDLIVEVARCLPTLRRGIDPTDKLVALYRSSGVPAVQAALRAALRGPARPDTIYLAWPLLLRAKADAVDLVAICHDEGVLVDAWTFTMANPDAGFDEREWHDFRAILQLGVDQITTDNAMAAAADYRRRNGE